MSVPFLVRCFSLCVLYLLSYKGRMARFSKGETRPKILSGRKFTPLWPNSKMQELKIDSQSELLIHKPTHGRVSHANDGAIQFT